MADALRGAFAPIPAAVRAALPTPHQAPAELQDSVLQRACRMLALVDMARALPLGDTPLPGDGESTDRDDKLSALLHGLTIELQALHSMAAPEAGEWQAVRADAGPAAVHQAAPMAAAGAADRLQFFELECTYHVAGNATVGDLACDAHSLVSSAVAVLDLADLTTDAQIGALHLLRQADGLLSLAHTKHERKQLAQRKQGGAA